MHVNEVGIVLRALGYNPPQAELDAIKRDADQQTLGFQVRTHFLSIPTILFFCEFGRYFFPVPARMSQSKQQCHEVLS